MAAISEYTKYSAPKARPLDRLYIESFDGSVLNDVAKRVGAQYWVPSNFKGENDANDIDENGEMCVAVNGDASRRPKAESAPPFVFHATQEDIRRSHTV